MALALAWGFLLEAKKAKKPQVSFYAPTTSGPDFQRERTLDIVHSDLHRLLGHGLASRVDYGFPILDGFIDLVVAAGVGSWPRNPCRCWCSRRGRRGGIGRHQAEMCGTFLERHDSGDVHTGHEEQHE